MRGGASRSHRHRIRSGLNPVGVAAPCPAKVVHPVWRLPAIRGRSGTEGMAGEQQVLQSRQGWWQGGSPVTAILGGAELAVSSSVRPPFPPTSLLRRARLLRWLDQKPVEVTLVCGHAGAGKTSLLAA
jgi:hypothetical protein